MKYCKIFQGTFEFFWVKGSDGVDLSELEAIVLLCKRECNFVDTYPSKL